MGNSRFCAFFQQVTDQQHPYPYQQRLADGAERGSWPELLEVPTGLGKTAAILCAWMWGRLRAPQQTGRRLVYCLPTRTLVRQTHQVAQQVAQRAEPFFQQAGQDAPAVFVLMGGELDEDWELHPERPAILVGTQDMLLSRALCRGYAMRRSKWPVHFGLLNNDVLWVFDEPQLMDVGVETGAQLHALRASLKTFGPAHTLWMSATVQPDRLQTVDVRRHRQGGQLVSLGLDDQDRQDPRCQIPLQASKRLQRWKLAPQGTDKKAQEQYLKDLAEQVAQRHAPQGLTLVILNTVERAQKLYALLREQLGSSIAMALVHGRMRPPDRQRHEHVLLQGQGERIVVATQAIEAGVDVSAELLVTELAPWPSLVQRFGRCNRYGERAQGGEIGWIELPETLAAPYEAQELQQARGLLEALEQQGADASAQRLARLSASYRPPPRFVPVLRRKDLLELFDTTPDLFGDDVDVSPFVRDAGEPDVFVFYRDFDAGEGPGADEPAPAPDELVRVPVGVFRTFATNLIQKARDARDAAERNRLHPWVVDPLAPPGERRWVRMRQPKRELWPGRRVLLHPSAGGYDHELGWTGQRQKKPVPPVVPPAPPPGAVRSTDEHVEADPRSAAGRWVELSEHLRDVHQEAQTLAAALQDVLVERWQQQAVELAAAWHDAGKAHPAFQAKLCFEPPAGSQPPPKSGGPWAKAPHRRMRLGGEQRRKLRQDPNWGRQADRPFFRHELASALAWLAWARSPQGQQELAERLGNASGVTPLGREGFADLVAYLVAAHHGKVRLSIRSLPEELEAPPPDQAPSLPEEMRNELERHLPRPFARGVWHGDALPLVTVPGHTSLPSSAELDLRLLRLGEGSWVERTQRLLEALGPFRLGLLEALVRVADWRASNGYGQAPAASVGDEEESKGRARP